MILYCWTPKTKDNDTCILYFDCLLHLRWTDRLVLTKEHSFSRQEIKEVEQGEKRQIVLWWNRRKHDFVSINWDHLFDLLPCRVDVFTMGFICFDHYSCIYPKTLALVALCWQYCHITDLSVHSVEQIPFSHWHVSLNNQIKWKRNTVKSTKPMKKELPS